MSVSKSCSWLFLDIDVWNLLILVADTCMSMLYVDHTCIWKTSFPQNCQPSSRALHNYSVITLGLLASTFKVLIGLPLVILLARHERTGYDEDFLVTSMRARTLPSQNACRVKADGMGPSCLWRFSAATIYSRLDHYGPICVIWYVWM